MQGEVASYTLFCRRENTGWERGRLPRRGGEWTLEGSHSRAWIGHLGSELPLNLYQGLLSSHSCLRVPIKAVLCPTVQ